MTRRALKLAIVCSLALNAGVITAVAYRSYTADATRAGMSDPGPALADRLALTPAQRVPWEAAEKRFLEDLEADAEKLHAHRTRLVHAIFAAEPNPTAIESERKAIAELQQKQQRRVIEQLVAERAILDAEQRPQLAALLLRQQPGSGAEQLHRK